MYWEIDCYAICWKDTVAKQYEYNEIDAVKHSTVDATLRSYRIKHNFIPVFSSQYLQMHVFNIFIEMICRQM